MLSSIEHEKTLQSRNQIAIAVRTLMRPRKYSTFQRYLKGHDEKHLKERLISTPRKFL